MLGFFLKNYYGSLQISPTYSFTVILLKNQFRRWEFKLYSIMTTTEKINVDLAIDFVEQMRSAEGKKVRYFL